SSYRAPTSNSVVQEENEKLNKRLQLLRDEYVKLQTKYADLQARYDRLAARQSNSAAVPAPGDTVAPAAGSDSVEFVSKILDFIGHLFNNPSYSDLTVEYRNGGRLAAHKFVLKFRSPQWG